SGSIAIVAAGSLLIEAFNRSTQLYALLSVAFAAYGMWSLIHRDAGPCHEPRGRAASLGGTFLVGAMSALLPSPCCSPVLLGLAALSAGSADILHVVALAAAFALGHVLPLAAASLTLAPVIATFTGNRARGAVRTVGAGLCLALGALYGILA
ncbi:MAG TPA: cytochrome c biogenesis protein CcdA, partial [Candidatus Baltobacteraceae bacterium]|nr:cytochrome c biogenesis protein CcdA [Candidatus Baltobacteraceae bacterium]